MSLRPTKWPERLKDHPLRTSYRGQPIERAAPTGRYWISPCATASVYEWSVSGELWCIGSVAGHGYTVAKNSIEQHMSGPGGSAFGTMSPTKALEYA